ncbi:MAG: pentapeptide repeat-containing protein [Xanthomonadaceae bacterium]|jgi:hypothetical protein|nr:pentapeptide repeat-containing protein [Xanthomonadaceae bacterium]
METTMDHAQQSIRSRTGRAASMFAMALIATATFAVCIPDANAARGGRGGGQMAGSSVSGANRSAYGGNRANTGNVNTGNVNRGNINTGNVNRGNINTGNVNIGNDVNIDIDGGYGHHGGYYHHPVATAAAIGAVAVTTAAVVGSYYYALPPSGCTVVIRAGVNYHYCGSVYYQQTFSGDKVVYVVVNP